MIKASNLPKAHPFLNKSLLTNLFAAGLVLLSYAFARTPYQNILSHVGFFALSGALTNWLAIIMLFDKIPFLYGSGVIPLRFEEFKSGIRDLVMSEFFTPSQVSEIASEFKIDKEKWNKIADAIDYDQIYAALVEGILESRFGKMVSVMGGNEAIEPLRIPIQQKLRKAVETVLQDEQLQKQFIEIFTQEKAQAQFLQSIEKMVDRRLDQLTPKMVKDIIQNMMRTHLGWLVVWGGVFGGLIGLVTSFVV